MYRFKRLFTAGSKFNILTIFLNFIGNLFFAYCMIIAIALIIFSSVTIECRVVGPSMQPTLNADTKAGNDIVYVNKYDRDFCYGDIVVLNVANNKDPLIKRVIGVGGDIIDIVDNGNGYKLEVNGKLIEEDYLKIDYSIVDPRCQDGNDISHSGFLVLQEKFPELFVEMTIDNKVCKKLKVPDGEVFVLGDNRHVSRDSTFYGTFKNNQIDGIVERIRYSKDGSFNFYWDYIVKGKFFETISKCF